MTEEVGIPNYHLFAWFQMEFYTFLTDGVCSKSNLLKVS